MQIFYLHIYLIYQLAAISELPPGTIIAWIPGADEQPPNRWEICDGRPITEGKWEGKNTPDLTHAFLIGGVKEDVDVHEDGPKPFLGHYNVEDFKISGEEFQPLTENKFCAKDSRTGCATANCNCPAGQEFISTIATFKDIQLPPPEHNLPTYEVVYIMRVRQIYHIYSVSEH